MMSFLGAGLVSAGVAYSVKDLVPRVCIFPICVNQKRGIRVAPLLRLLGYGIPVHTSPPGSGSWSIMTGVEFVSNPCND